MKLQIPYGKLSGYKVGKILKHFVVDVEASKTSELLNLNRKTVDDYYNLFRKLIYLEQKQEFTRLSGTIELDESYFGARRIRGKHIKLKRGRGTVGLCAVIAAKRLGAKRIIAMSNYPTRQALAKKFGATDIIAERGDAAVQRVMTLTDGVGVDAALECVGTDEALQTAIAATRPGGMVGFVGLPHDVDVPLSDMLFRNVGLRGGIAPARVYIPELLKDVLSGKISPGLVFDFETDLDHVDDAYKVMDERRAIKSLLRISEP